MKEHQDTYNNFSTQLRLLRKRKNLSQEKLSELLGYYSKFIGRLENEERTPSIDVLISLSKYFDVPIDYLVLGDKNIAPEVQSIFANLSHNQYEAVIAFAQYILDHNYFKN